MPRFAGQVIVSTLVAAAVGVSAPRARAQPAPGPAPQPAQPAPGPPERAAPPAAPERARGPAVPADEATVWDEPPGTESEDVGLFVPRAILTLPRIALKVVFWPIQHGLRFTERHAIIE